MPRILERLRENPITERPHRKHHINIVGVLINEETGEKRTVFGANIVTNDGDIYYAQAAAGTAAPTYFTPTGMNLGSSAVAPSKSDTNVGSIVASGSVATDSGYPKVNDNDADNTGGGSAIVSWRFSFGTAAANANGIQECAIVNTLGTAGNKAVMRGTLASFNKTSSDTLKVFVNHTFTGV